MFITLSIFCKVDILVALPLLHVGGIPFQYPDDWQDLTLKPDIFEYPLLHSYVAFVPTIYPPMLKEALKLILPLFGAIIHPQITGTKT